MNLTLEESNYVCLSNRCDNLTQSGPSLAEYSKTLPDLVHAKVILPSETHGKKGKNEYASVPYSALKAWA